MPCKSAKFRAVGKMELSIKKQLSNRIPHKYLHLFAQITLEMTKI